MDKKFQDKLKRIGHKVKMMRMKARYKSAETFAWEAKIPLVNYRRLEKGTNCTLRTLERVLRTHKMSMSEFFSDID